MCSKTQQSKESSALNLDVFKQYQILLLLGFAILTPIFEELIFRGFILRFFSERFPFWIAPIITSFFFGIAHTYSLGVMVITFFMGLLMAILCKKQNPLFQLCYFILWIICWHSWIRKRYPHDTSFISRMINSHLYQFIHIY